MNVYESPTLEEVGSVREFTLGGLNIFDWSDEVRYRGHTYPAPGPIDGFS